MMKKIKGFTLIEFIIALTIGAIIIMGTGFILANGKKNQIIQIQKEAMQREATDLGNLLSRYTRSLGIPMCVDPGLKGPPPISAALNMKEHYFNHASFRLVQRGEFTTYDFKIRKSFVTEEQNGANLSASGADYFTMMPNIDPDRPPYVLASNCIDSISLADDLTNIEGQEIYVLDRLQFHLDSLPVPPSTRKSPGLVLRGGAGYDTVDDTKREFFENVTSFDVYYAERLAGTDYRDPDKGWIRLTSQLILDNYDGADPLNSGGPIFFSPDLVALKFVFTLKPSLQIVGQAARNSETTAIENKTFEVVAAIRNLDPWK